MRLDIYLVQNGFFKSRELAKFNILKGNISVNENIVLKPSYIVNENDEIGLLQQNAIPYVSRGGLKLEKGLIDFQINCAGFVALDVGASTGGFTDCLLKFGASKVYAIDVGNDQLSPKLKSDPRVVSMEKINIKELSPESLYQKEFDLIVADLSFISLSKVIDLFPKFLHKDGMVIALIKPQFELEKNLINKGGVVKSKKSHILAIERVISASKECGLHLAKLSWAPIHNSGKNIEYLGLFIQKWIELPNIQEIVVSAFRIKESKLKQIKT